MCSYEKNLWQCFRKAHPEGFLPVHQGQILRALLERPAGVRVPAARPEYLWAGDECVKLWETHGPRFMLSISYGWLHEDHPDPEMFHLKRLAKVVMAFKKFHSIDGEDCAVFLDFCSLWQRELVDGVDTRTPEQILQFKEALDEMNTKQSPPCVSRPCQRVQCELTTCEDGPNLRRGSSIARVHSGAA